MHEKGIRVLTIGDMSKFDDDIQKSVHDMLELTKYNTRITVIFALNYGGRDEIIRAVNRMAAENRLHEFQSITAERFERCLDSAGTPDPELIIRTGGEQRLSGFLLWQSQYSELYFPTWYMPDFTPEKLDEAMREYGLRQRRFGK
jgi:undecaprenyl diphosphate synthase